MVIRNPYRVNVFSLRRTLLTYHKALFFIDSAVAVVDEFSPLSCFETYVVALEDRRFFTHRGFSPRDAFRALVTFAKKRRASGASTIDMQFFRTACGQYERTISRKFYEILGASLLQRHYSKMQILRGYLNTAYFGTGLTGCNAAVSAMFGKTLSEIDDDESAQLAALLVYPKPSFPSINWLSKIRRRANYAKIIAPRLEKKLEKLPSWDAI